MSEITIKNEQVSVTINTLGAEIQSIKSKDGFEYIWNDVQRKYWKRHAPILFPIIGRLNNDTYLYNNHKYELTQHGFLRDQQFNIVMQDVNFVKLESRSTEITKEKYPFDYEFTVLYQLSSKALQIQYTIVNQGTNTLYYSLGLHPGFALEHDLSNYHLIFEPHANEIRQMEVSPAPFINGKSELHSLKSGELGLNYKKLDNGLVIYDVRDMKNVSLVNTQSSHSVKLNIEHFPYLAVWSPEHKKAPFVCVEPFKGLPDVYGDPRPLQDKLGTSSILSGKKHVINTAIDLF